MLGKGIADASYREMRQLKGTAIFLSSERWGRKGPYRVGMSAMLTFVPSRSIQSSAEKRWGAPEHRHHGGSAPCGAIAIERRRDRVVIIDIRVNRAT